MQRGAFFIDIFLRTLHAIHDDIVCREGGGYNSEVRPVHCAHPTIQLPLPLPTPYNPSHRLLIV